MGSGVSEALPRRSSVVRLVSEAKVKDSYHQCKSPTIVDRHFCAYHSGLAGPRFDPFRDIGEEEDFLEYQPVDPDSVA